MRVLFAAVGLVLCLGLVLLATLWPTPIDRGYESAIEHVLSVLHRNGMPGWYGYGWLEATANVLMFIPLGFLLALVFPTRLMWVTLLLVPVVSSALEGTQLLLLPARFASPIDVMANSLGGWLGVGLAAIAVVVVHERDRRVLARWRAAHVITLEEARR